MADVSTAYVLTGTGSVTFNAGDLGDGTDKYWIQKITGLDQAPIRNPFDLVPFGTGGTAHTFRKGPRHITIEGFLLIESSTSQTVCVELRNNLEVALINVLDSILATNGTLAWTPDGEAARSLGVRSEVAADFQDDFDFRVKTFNFGLFAGNPDW